jgi:hypothetical protein
MSCAIGNPPAVAVAGFSRSRHPRWGRKDCPGQSHRRKPSHRQTVAAQPRVQASQQPGQRQRACHLPAPRCTPHRCRLDLRSRRCSPCNLASRRRSTTVLLAVRPASCRRAERCTTFPVSPLKTNRTRKVRRSNPIREMPRALLAPPLRWFGQAPRLCRSWPAPCPAHRRPSLHTPNVQGRRLPAKSEGARHR